MVITDARTVIGEVIRIQSFFSISINSIRREPSDPPPACDVPGMFASPCFNSKTILQLYTNYILRPAGGVAGGDWAGTRRVNHIWVDLRRAGRWRGATAISWDIHRNSMGYIVLTGFK
jgi:hypothetical protein